MEYTLEELAYPIGRFSPPGAYDNTLLAGWTDVIASCPAWYDAIIENLDEAQLKTPYRPGGWNIIQVIHHVADSHMNAYIRLKMMLTEDTPVVKPYNEKLWSELPDIYEVPVNISLTLIHSLHRRWVAVLRNLGAEDWNREYYHPEQEQHIPLWIMTAMYAWHCRHHFEHIRGLRDRMHW